MTITHLLRKSRVLEMENVFPAVFHAEGRSHTPKLGDLKVCEGLSCAITKTYLLRQEDAAGHGDSRSSAASLIDNFAA